MNNLRLILSRVALAVLPLVLTSLASAQATRTWVSGVGNDANPCSRTSPCATFAGALPKTAASGEIDCLDPGDFGQVTITKSITIDCGSKTGGIYVGGGGTGVWVNAGSSDVVTLRNLVLNSAGGSSYGIEFSAARSLHLVNVTLTNFSTGILVLTASPAQLTVNNATISDSLNDAIFMNPSSSLVADLSHVRLWNNRGSGLATVGNATNVSIRDSSIAMNYYGVAQNSALGDGTMLVVSSQFTANTVAVISNTASNISVSKSTFGQNGTVFNPNSGCIFTDGQNLPAPGNVIIGTANCGMITRQ